MNIAHPRVSTIATSDIKRFDGVTELQRQAALDIAELANSAVERRGVCNISLSGGSTPGPIYRRLADQSLPWEKIHWFWGDERHVPPDSDESNFRMVREALLDVAGVPESNVHRVPAEMDDAASAARRYEATLRDHFGSDQWPAWDLMLLGMGDDAHTASLFPQTEALAEDQRWFVSNWVPKFDTHRLTLTVSAINSARQTWFLIAGENKRSAIASVLGQNTDLAEYPSQMIRADRWYVTTDAYPD